MDLATLEQQISTAIGQQETAGGTTGVGLSLNNPGGLQFSQWETQYGATQTASGFASFPSLSAGWSALSNRVGQLVNSGASVNSLINTWAPASAGNVNNASRVSQIASATGLDPNASIASQAASSSASGSAASAASSIASAVASGVLKSLGLGAGDGFSISRMAVFIVGIVCIIGGLLMLKQTQVVIQNVTEKAKQGAELAAA